MAKSLDWLVKVNDFLEQVPAGVLTYFKALSKSGEELVQTQVDYICSWLAWKVNIMVERKRQQVIKTLQEQYGGYLALMSGVSLVKQALNPLNAGAFFAKFAAPIVAIYDFLKTLIKEIPRLAENLANIANSLPPDPPNPHINYNAFKLRIGTISLGEIMGASTMPTPEEMFPEPPKPFSKAAFDASFQNAKAAGAEEGIVYKMPDVKTKLSNLKTTKLSGGSESDGTTIV